MTPSERIIIIGRAVTELGSNNEVVRIGIIRDAFEAILDDILERLCAEERDKIDQQSNLAGGLIADSRAVVRRIE